MTHVQPKAYYAVATIEQRKYSDDSLVQTWFLESRVYQKPGSASGFITRTKGQFKRTNDNYKWRVNVGMRTALPDTYEEVVGGAVYEATEWKPWKKKGK